jgi:hypothetical protein
MSTHLSALARNVQQEALAQLCNHGILRIFTGPQPDSITKPETGVLLGTITLDNPAFQPPQDGMIVANPMAPDPSAPNDGEAGWGRIYHADGITPLMDGDCATEINLVATHIVKGAVVACRSLQIVLPE